ncbi:hypothetical protein LY474_36165 [Myxococcus stipitatus]|uniref:hypothetical protein n=1 Tax=Myxococcus stipitatus TaxID=83455 RepID=UPI001F48965A|nr:hypothetical protein [Myxococcus stipitatus]MCE9673257.1 hypothetical protein [Myxococcus stipitatus]
MILPRHWDALTATLHAVDLEGNPEEAWRFLVYRGFVEDSAEGARRFVDLVRESLTTRHPPAGGPVGAILRTLVQEQRVDPRQDDDPEGRSTGRVWRLWKRRTAPAASPVS